MIPWRGVDAMGERFADLAEVREATGDAGAFVFDPASEVGAFEPLPDAPEGSAALTAWTDSGTFTEAGGFSFDQDIPISTCPQLVSVTLTVSSDSSYEPSTGLFLPTPWTFYVWDYTLNTLPVSTYGASGVGAGWASTVLWVVDEAAIGSTRSVHGGALGLVPDAHSCDVSVTFRTVTYS